MPPIYAEMRPDYLLRRMMICLFALCAMVFGNAAFAADEASVPAASTPAPTNYPKVTMHTNMGNIIVELYPDKSPKTVENFLRYVKDGHYSGTLFHRVIKGMLIQGGGYDVKMHEKTRRPPIKNEANNGLSNAPLTVAMAREDAPHTAAAQFFININDNKSLDYPSQDGWGYCVFGKVIDGVDTLDKIQEVEVIPQRGLMDNIPVQQVIIESVTINK